MQPVILVVDDEAPIISFLRNTLESQDYKVVSASAGLAGVETASKEQPHLVLLDYMLPDIDGLEVMRRIHQQYPGMCIIMMTADTTVATAVKAMHQGAFDYIPKPFNLEHLLASVKRGLKASLETRELLLLKRTEGKTSNREPEVIDLPALSSILDSSLYQAFDSGNTILLEGENGVGKKSYARHLFEKSAFAAGPFLTFNCSLLPDDEIEFELFGANVDESDSHTNTGLLELAHNGVLYLEEIASIPLPVQVLLVDSIKTGAFVRVNGQTKIHSDFKLIVSTCKNLQLLVDQGKFSEDLYFLLKATGCVMPPLRARQSDIMPIAQHYLGYYNAVYHKRIAGFNRDAELAMEAYHWPGNSRELSNSIEMAILKADSDLLEPVHLGLTPSGKTVENDIISNIVAAMSRPLDEEPVDLETLLSELETILVSKAMSAAGGNKSKAARYLGLNRDKIRYRLKTLAEEQN
ncbi:MAG: sigma-54-dependent Fis family transcriptional regulator [bacterium]|nr:sigma-54-dependent Fis family transcriptional regulator [bacterium]MCP4799574.1 sigma-54-dependent Fis family transcriptional regulator [bacterium]